MVSRRVGAWGRLSLPPWPWCPCAQRYFLKNGICSKKKQSTLGSALLGVASRAAVRLLWLLRPGVRALCTLNSSFLHFQQEVLLLLWSKRKAAIFAACAKERSAILLFSLRFSFFRFRLCRTQLRSLGHEDRSNKRCQK